MSDIIQFPNSKNITEPKPINLIDTAIVALEAINPPSGYLRSCLDLLRAEKRIRQARESVPE